MKKLILLITILAAGTLNAQSIYLDQEIMIPIGLGPNGESLDSLLVNNPREGFKYTLGTVYNTQGEVEKFYTKWVEFEDSSSNDVSLTISLNKISDTKRSAVMVIHDSDNGTSTDSTVMNYNAAGLQTSTYTYENDSNGFALRNYVIWYYPSADAFYSVKDDKDTVFYTATNGKVTFANTERQSETDKYEYTYDDNGMLTSILNSRKDSGAFQEVMTIIPHYSAGTASRSNHEHELNLSIFPNPTSSTIQVRSEKGCTVKIFDISGNHIRNLNSRCNEIINLSGLSKGYYIIKISDSFGGAETRKVLLR